MAHPKVENGRFIRAVRLVRSLAGYHPGLFATAVIAAAIFAICTVSTSFALRWVIDNLILPRFENGGGSNNKMLISVGLLVSLALVRAAGSIVRRTWAGKTQWRVAQSLTGEVVDVLVDQPTHWHRRQATGDLLTRAGIDVEAAVAVLAPLPYASSVVLMMLIASVGLISTDFVLGCAATGVFPILLLCNVVYQRKVDKWYDLAQSELGLLSTAVHESFEGVSIVKAFGAENRETERLAFIAAKVRTARFAAIRLRSFFETLLDLIPSLANIAIVGFGAMRVRDGHLSIGDLVSFIYMFTLLVFPLRLIGYALSELPRSHAGYKRIRSLTDQTLERDPRADLKDQSHGVDIFDITVCHLENRPVIRSFSANIPHGQVTAIVGSTGSGKTTLLHAIAGLIPLTHGQISSPVESSALVFQEPFLMGASIIDNVSMGREFSGAEISWALKVSEADFVEALPHGLLTIVGERGVGLSGGQRQRLALARAMVSRPTLLLLDDTTSALDPITELQVMANLRQESPMTTIVAVASRPSLIKMADSVLYIEDGQFVGQGTHEELMASNSSYGALMAAYDHDHVAVNDE